MKSPRSIEVLCLALAALALVWSKALLAHPWPIGALLGGFAAVILAFRSRLLWPDHPRVKLQLESWSMVCFVSGVLWFTGRGASPLLNLYLLPIILSAFTLGRATTMIQVLAIAVVHVALAASTADMQVLSAAYASRATGELAPFLLVAYLTTTLSADITEAREHIENLAQTDALTGLYNVRMFNEVWQREHAACDKGQGVYSLLMVDLDRLGQINDAFGHEGGNSALQLVSQCLQRSIRGTDVAARIGGDEFAVLLPGAAPDVAEAVVKRIRHNVYKTTLDLRSRMIRCSVSVGVANFPKDGREINELQSIADRNMYRDKELRRAPGAATKV